MEEALKQKSALSHAEYINRENAYKHRGGCIFQFHCLPKWANDDHKKFFQAADKYEVVGHRRYVEDGSLPSFEEKWKRGASKDRKWCNHQYVTELRADFAHIQNAVLEQNGFSIRVDHRSLKAQKEEAEHKGDFSLARLFSRVPEKYVGVISCQDYEEPRLERLKIFRGTE